MSKAGG
jgi:hypothetical protein